MTPLEALNARLVALAEAGTLPPCAGRDKWTSDEAAEQERAREGCSACPAASECHAAALDIRATAGTWAGITYEMHKRARKAS